MKRDLRFAHFGNGLMVYDKLHEENGDYQTVAHIDPYRNITFYKSLETCQIEQIEKEAACSDPAISFSQSQKVFIDRPKTVTE